MLPITGEELIRLIPQRPPFVMIGSLLAAGASACTTAFTITADNVLCDHGRLNPSGLMENIAQSAAAMSGYAAMSAGEKQGIGFIGDMRDFSYTRLPAVGEQIITEVVVEAQVFDVTIVSGWVKLNDEKIASCKMKIFRMAAK